MDQLAQVRLVLAQLKQKHRGLHIDLAETTAEIQACEDMIEVLVRAKAPINSLPSEILSYVLELALPPDEEYDYTAVSLASVSRTWRDIILDSPKFWNRIEFVPGAIMSLVEARVARSGHLHPLDISIVHWGAVAPLYDFMDVIVPHVSRWRSLEISGRYRCLLFVLDKFNGLNFPSLTRATIDLSENGRYIQYPSFLRPENCLSLQSLHLETLGAKDECPPGPRISDISIKFFPHPFGSLTLPSLLSSQNLTTLNLAYSRRVTLEPDSISLPVLTSLTLQTNRPRGLISVIVAPQLSYFRLVVASPNDRIFSLLHGFESKFCNVEHLGLRDNRPHPAVEGAESISSVFPAVRHLELHTMQFDGFFRMTEDGSTFKDRWESLESLTLYGMQIFPDPHIEDFVRWLSQWNSMGRPMLRVKFVGCAIRLIHGVDVEEKYSISTALLQLHESLRDICILDIKVMLQAKTAMSLTSSSPPQVCIAIVADLVTMLISCVLAVIRPCWSRLMTDIWCARLKKSIK